jgi:DNA polymerase/3'-5' exonuclease PolX
MVFDYYKDILLNLQKFANYYKLNNDIFRYKAYQKAINNIKSYKEKNSNFIINKPEDVKNIKGIGDSIYDKIKQLIDTGHISQLDKIEKYIKQRDYVISDLMNIYGIGIIKANKLYNEHNITSIKKLRDIIKKKPDLLNKKQKIGLKYYDNLLLKIPRDEMIIHDKYISSFFDNFDNEKKLKYIFTGSYRRKKESSGDIDILVYIKDINNDEKYAENIFSNIVNKMAKTNYIIEILAKGKKKLMGICKLPHLNYYRRIDMIYTNLKHYPFALLYFTGSGKFNIDLRNSAIEQGYSLNEYSLTNLKSNEEIKMKNGNYFKSEKDIFNFLGYKYIEPENRTGGILQNYKL